MSQSIREQIEQAIALRFSPAIDSYVKIMLNMSIEDIVDIIKEKTIEAMAHEGIEIEIRQKVIKRLYK